MENLTLFNGAIIALVFFVWVVIQFVRKQPGHGWLSRVLAWIALIVTVAALWLNSLSGIVEPGAERPLLAVSAVGIGLGLILFLLERKRTGYVFGKSWGAVSAGVGVLLIASLLMTPLIMNLTMGGAGLSGDPFTQTAMASGPEAESEVVSLSAEELAALDGPPPSPTPSPTPQPTQMLFPTATFTLYPTGTPMPTLPALLLPTSTPGVMPELVTSAGLGATAVESAGGSDATCLVTTGANLNLRQAPGTGEAILTTIPNSTNLEATATTADRQWWQVTYDGQIGWVVRDYLIFGPDCGRMG